MRTPCGSWPAAATVRAKHILVATGGAPQLGAEIAGLEHVISSNEAFHLDELPKRILIQGGGYIAVEFACIFNGLGSDVTLVYRGENILRGFDDDVREHLRGEMERRGIKIVTRQTVEAVEKVDHGYCVELTDHESVRGRQGHVRDRPPAERRRAWVWSRPASRCPRTARSRSTNILRPRCRISMRLATSPTGSISRRSRSGKGMRSPIRCSAAGRRRVDHADVPTAVFSEPELGVIGLTEAQACAQLAKVDIYKTSFRSMKMTLAGRDTRSFFKLVVDGETDRVVGCHIVGPDAGEMIQLIGIAVKMKRDQGGLRRHDGGASDRGRGTRHAAAEGLQPRAAGCGVSRRAGGFAAGFRALAVVYKPVQI